MTASQPPTLSPEQCDFVRELMFDELKDAAEALAGHAHEAAEVLDNRIAGTDARGVWRHRVRASAEVLDTIGWSTPDEGQSLTAIAPPTPQERERWQLDADGVPLAVVNGSEQSERRERWRRDPDAFYADERLHDAYEELRKALDERLNVTGMLLCGPAPGPQLDATRQRLERAERQWAEVLATADELLRADRVHLGPAAGPSAGGGSEGRAPGARQNDDQEGGE